MPMSDYNEKHKITLHINSFENILIYNILHRGLQIDI